MASSRPAATAASSVAPASIRAAIDCSISTHCSPAPPCTSPSTFIADAIALFRPTPQVAAMRAIAMLGAWGPWSTAAISAMSSSWACSAPGSSPRVISQIICAKLTCPIRSSIAWPR